MEAGFLFVEIEESVVKQLLTVLFFSTKKRKKIANDMLNILSGGCFSCFICIYDMQYMYLSTVDYRLKEKVGKRIQLLPFHIFSESVAEFLQS